MPGIHHVEIWVRDLATAAPEWAWLLGRLGYVCTAQWTGGQTWALADTTGATPHLTLTTPPTVADAAHDRRLPGVNHLAFWGGGPDAVDGIINDASANGWTPLYPDRYPDAGGADHYAGWLENADGFKVEVVALTAEQAAQ